MRELAFSTETRNRHAPSCVRREMRAASLVVLLSIAAVRPSVKVSGDYAMLGEATKAAVLITQPGHSNPEYARHALDAGWLVQAFQPPM